MDDPQASHYVMQWVKGEIEFIPLSQKLAEIGHYKHEDWKSLFDQLFNHSEDDDTVGAIATVQTAMRAHGLILGSEPTDQHLMPSES
jgi:hypothetical protein